MERTAKYIISKPIDDYPGIFLYEEAESLAGTNFTDSPQRSLARADLHGSRISDLIKAEFKLQSKAVAETIRPFLMRALPVLNSLSPQELKNWALFLARHANYKNLIQRAEKLAETWIGYEVAKGNLTENLNIIFQQIDKAKLAELLPAVARFYIESAPLTFWQEVLDSLKVAANETLTTPLDSAFVELIPMEEAAKMQALDSDKFIKELATSDPDAESKLRSMLSTENRAVVEDRKATHGWGGDRNKAFEILDGVLKVKLEAELKVKRWHIPGARYEGKDSWEKPSNDEPQLLQIGEFHGLEWARKQDLLELLSRGASGELRNTLIKIAINTLFGGIRKQNRTLGIEVPPDWSNEGKTEDEIREQLDKDLRASTSREVLDRKIQSKDGYINILEQGQDKQAFTEWTESRVEEEAEEATALKMEKLTELSHKAKLTPRLRLVAKLYDKPNDEIAARLQKEFRKPFTVGAVRALKYDLLVKLKEASKKK